MNKYAIIADSTCDLDKDIITKKNIDYVRMNISYDNKETYASLDWDLYSPKELYDVMRNGKRVMTTMVPFKEFEDCFTKHLEQGEDILYIGCSSALSGSVNNAITLLPNFKEKYPKQKILVIDSLNSCLGQGIMLIEAADMRDEGKTIDEVYEYINDTKLNVNQFATVESLDYLKRAGRVKASSAFFGNIFGVKPIIISDAKGQNFAVKKVKGRRSSLLELVNLCKENIVDPENQYIFLGHADCLEDCEFLKSHVEQEIKCKGIYMNYIGPIIGASTGPGTVAIYFVGKKVTTIGE